MGETMSHSGDEFGKFFIPGPTEVRQEVLMAMARPMIPHRSDEFESLFARVQTGLREVFCTTRPVFITASSGTGMMEAGIRCTEPGPVLCLVNGAFSERFARIAEMCGREVDRYEVPWGGHHSVDELGIRLATREYRAITVAHSETSTGALNDIRKLSDQAHAQGVRCLVDSVSGLAGAEVQTDDWQLDYVLTGSQKALALPPGLAFSVASQDFMDSAVNAQGRGVYFDLVEMEQFALKGQVPSTPAVSLFYALDVQLEAIHAEGMNNRWNRHRAMAEMTNEWLERVSHASNAELRNIVSPGQRSPTVSTIELPADLSTEEFLSRVASRGIRVASGYGKLKSTTFRIGHMGDHSPATLERCLAACEAAING
jgi:aspartate aminotransferase-like enzyme